MHYLFGDEKYRNIKKQKKRSTNKFSYNVIGGRHHNYYRLCKTATLQKIMWGIQKLIAEYYAVSRGFFCRKKDSNVTVKGLRVICYAIEPPDSEVHGTSSTKI